MLIKIFAKHNLLETHIKFLMFNMKNVNILIKNAIYSIPNIVLNALKNYKLYPVYSIRESGNLKPVGFKFFFSAYIYIIGQIGNLKPVGFKFPLSGFGVPHTLGFQGSGSDFPGMLFVAGMLIISRVFFISNRFMRNLETSKFKKSL